MRSGFLKRTASGRFQMDSPNCKSSAEAPALFQRRGPLRRKGRPSGRQAAAMDSLTRSQ